MLRVLRGRRELLMRPKILPTFIFLGFVFLALAFGVSTARSDEMPLEKQAPLPVGTVITTQNWQQYKDYMPVWMQALFSGQYWYKLGPTQQIVVGPTIPKTLPKAYLADTEKYSSQVRLQELPEGSTLIKNYTAGLPFPHPSEPDLGSKILWNLWYRYTPHVDVETNLHTMLVNKDKTIFTELLMFDYLRLGHVSEPGLPIYTPGANQEDTVQYLSVTEPEQSKYTVSLIIYFLDPTRQQEYWSFVPSLRRPLRLSASARCAPSVGSDSVVDDSRSGFNMRVSDVTAHVVAHKKTLMMTNVQPPYPANIDFTDPKTAHLCGTDTGITWPPPPSKWELGETWVVEVAPTPDKLAGYCYGNRRMYIDVQDYHMPGEDLYDMAGKLWKIPIIFFRMHPNGYGDSFETGSGNQ